MRKLLLLLFAISFSFCLSAQVKYGAEITGKYCQFWSWSYTQSEYIVEDEGWYEIRILPEADYYLVNFDDEEIEKIWWDYSERDEEDGSDIYYTEDGRKVVFNYDTQKIFFFYDADKNERYKKVIAVSKLEVFE